MTTTEIERQSNVIAVVFMESRSYNSKKYHYFCKYPIKVGDHVIVDSPINGYTCVEVVEIKPKGSMKATKHVIQVVDDTEYKADQERQKRAEEIRATLNRKKSEFEEMAVFRMLAKDNPEVQKLVDELEQLAA